MTRRVREPFWGPNAKPFFIQLAVGTAVSFGLYYAGLWDFLYFLSCRFLTGSC